MLWNTPLPLFFSLFFSLRLIDCTLHTPVCMHTHTQTHTHVHACMHTHTCTQTHISLSWTSMVSVYNMLMDISLGPHSTDLYDNLKSAITCEPCWLSGACTVKVLLSQSHGGTWQDFLLLLLFIWLLLFLAEVVWVLSCSFFRSSLEKQRSSLSSDSLSWAKPWITKRSKPLVGCFLVMFFWAKPWITKRSKPLVGCFLVMFFWTKPWITKRSKSLVGCLLLFNLLVFLEQSPG